MKVRSAPPIDASPGASGPCLPEPRMNRCLILLCAVLALAGGERLARLDEAREHDALGGGDDLRLRELRLRALEVGARDGRVGHGALVVGPGASSVEIGRAHV